MKNTEYPVLSCMVNLILMTVSGGKLKILLIPGEEKNSWAMPGRFVHEQEDLDEAVSALLTQETTADHHIYFRQMYTFGNTERDERARVLSTVYFSMTPESNIRKIGDGNARWFTVDKKITQFDEQSRDSILELSTEDQRIVYKIRDTVLGNYVQTRSEASEESDAILALDHIKAVNMAVDLLKNRAASTGIIFNLLSGPSTLREIQTVFEAIRGAPTDTGNFRRDIKKMLKETGQYKIVHGKKALLYTFNPLYEYVKENL